MIRSIAIKNRVNSKQKFETAFILTESGIKQLSANKKFGTNTADFIEYLISFSKVPENVQVEVIYQPTKGQRKVKERKFTTADGFPIPSGVETEWRSRYNSLTEQERNVFDLLLRNFKQQQICKKLNIQLNTEKYYRKSIYRKIGLSDLSLLTNEERNFLLIFANK